VFQCNGCEALTLQPVGKNIEVGESKKYAPGTGPVVGKTCDECNHVFKIGGPIWSEPIHDMEFLGELLKSVDEEKESYKTFDRIYGALTVMQEELQDQPLYYVLDKMCNIIHATTPSNGQFKSALIHAGYKVSSTHCNENGFKTDASIKVIWDILRCWVKLHPVKESKVKERTAAEHLLSKEAELEANFEVLPSATPRSKILKLTRFQINPEADWGPKARAKQSGKYENLTDKRYALQGKRQRNRDIDYTKQFQCKRFKRGECEKGASCKFSHDEQTSNNKQTVMSVDVNDKKTINSVDVNDKDTTMSVDAKT